MSFLSYQFSALSSLFHFSLLSLLFLLSPIPSLSSLFIPSLLSPIHYLSYILSQFSLLSSFISAPISVSLFYSSSLLYPLILSLDTLTSVPPLHSPSSLFSLISLLFLPLSLRHFLFFLSIFSILCPLPDLSPLHSLLFLLSPTLLHSLSPPCSFSSRGLEGKWGGRKAGG